MAANPGIARQIGDAGQVKRQAVAAGAGVGIRQQGAAPGDAAIGAGKVEQRAILQCHIGCGEAANGFAKGKGDGGTVADLECGVGNGNAGRQGRSLGIDRIIGRGGSGAASIASGVKDTG